MKKRPSVIIIILLVILCSYYTVKERWQGQDGKAWSMVIQNDGYGYYVYLPCLFMHHSLDYEKTFGDIRQFHPDYSDNYFIGYVFPPNTYDKRGTAYRNKYTIGTAILILPFFLLAYFLSFITGANLNGYGFLFQASVSVAALFYLTIGLLYLRKLLKQYGVSEWGIGLTCIALVLSTNLFYYATIETSISHVYSFGLTAVFLYYAKKSIETLRLKHLAAMASLLATLILVRPTNILSVLMIPFLAGTFYCTKTFLLKLFMSYKVIIVTLIGASIISLQLIVWHIETGNWLIWSYGVERFNFNDPHFFDILFSFRKGWFIYTPFMFIMLVSGFISLYNQSVFKFSVMLIYFIAITYVLSSWWYWAYGGSFGSRPFVDYYAAFCLLPAFWHRKLTGVFRKICVILFIAVFSTINLIQTYQYINCIIPTDSEKMNAKIFWKMFLETSPLYSWAYAEIPDTSNYVFNPRYTFENDFENNLWGGDSSNLTSIISHGGKYAAYVDKSNQRTPTFIATAKQLPVTSPVYVYVSLWFYVSHRGDNAALVISFNEKDKDDYFATAKQLRPLAYNFNSWNKADFMIELPALRNNDDVVKLYVSADKGKVLVDDMKIRFGTRKP
jgi:hypothetical protein